jgi:hypothetical protein
MSQVPASPSPSDQPLGLTVHDLPTPEQAAQPPTRMGRWKMLFILLVCASPVIASYLTYYVIRPEGRRNFGELINPQRPLPDLQARALDGQPVALRSLKDQWLLVSVGGGDCAAACQQNLYFQRQLRESLGREKDRLDRVWLISDDAPVADALQPALDGATVLRVPPEQLAAWLVPTAGQALQAHLFVVDPLGNLMMRFPPGLDLATAAKAKKDLERLLRASNSWDQPGRP